MSLVERVGLLATSVENRLRVWTVLQPLEQQVIVLLLVTAVCSLLLGMSCVGCAWGLSMSRHRTKKAGVFPGHVFFSPYGDCYHLKDDCHTLRNRPTVKNLARIAWTGAFSRPSGQTSHDQRAKR